jgi:glycerol-3-phosphate acyltransferase PlsX
MKNQSVTGWGLIFERGTIMKKIALDALGSDKRPNPEILGAIKALRENDDILIYLIGKEEILHNKLRKFQYDTRRLKIINADQEVRMSESPTKALREKKNSSIKIGMDFLKKEADAFISAGNTGALMTHALMQIGRIKEIKRPAISTIIPTPYGETILIDSGANADAKPIHLLQFAIMGEIYAKIVFNKKNPKIGLLSNGEEEKKGNKLTKETNKLLKKHSKLNFIGNVEGRDILSGEVDVVVCDGFTGNIVLKTVESIFKFIFKIFKTEIANHLLAKIGLLLLKPSLKRLLKKMDYSEFGSAPLLGIKKPVLVAHGTSDEKAIKNSINFTYKYISEDFSKMLHEEIKDLDIDK